MKRSTASRLVVSEWIAFVALLIPASRIAPALYAWRIRSRIYRWYGELKFLEHEIREHFTAERVAAFMQGLDRIEEQANARPVPLAYTNELYILREHIDLVRGALARRHAMAGAPGAAASGGENQSTEARSAEAPSPPSAWKGPGGG